MIIRRSEDGFQPESAEVIGILAYESEPENLLLDPLRGEMRDFCRRHILNENFRGKPGSHMFIYLFLYSFSLFVFFVLLI